MNILLITHIFPPAIDGGSRVIFKLGEQLKKNHKILCLTSDCSSTDDFINPKSKSIYTKYQIPNTKYQILRIPVHKSLRRPLKFLCLFLPKNFYIRHLLEVLQKGPIFKIIPFIKALTQIFKFKPQLIIAGPLPTTIILYANFIKSFTDKINNFPSFSQRRGLRGRFRSKLLINASFHETDMDFLKTPLINTLKKSDYVWTLTEHEKEYFIKNLKVKSQKIILAGNGIDKNTLINPKNITFPQKPNLLFIGSLAAHKRVELLIEVFEKLSNIYPDMSLTIAGQKTLYFPIIQNKIKKLKNKKNIMLVFNFPQENLLKLIDSCSILILPSVQESFGLVLIEAMARGKPVIASMIPSSSELITKSKGGLCYKTDSIKDLQQKIITLIHNKNLSQQLGNNGLEYVKSNYTWKKVSQKICQKILC